MKKSVNRRILGNIGRRGGRHTHTHTPTGGCLWINHLLALTRSVCLSVELRPKRTRKSREVTNRRRSDAELKFRNPLPATRRCLKCSPLGSSLEHSKKFSLPLAAESSPSSALLGHAWQTECCLNSTLKPFLKIIGGRINHRKFFFPLPEGWRSESWTWCVISTERRGRWWAARRGRSQRPQKNPQNPEGRQVADRDQGRSEGRGGQEETHSRERGTQEETPRGKKGVC